jgi:Ca2+-transporting ATPase
MLDMPAIPPPNWHSIEPAAAAESLQTDIHAGLTAAEAARRLEEHGPNELATMHAPSAWLVLGRQFHNVLIWILIGAAGLSVFLGEAVEAIAIGVIVLISVVLGFAQEFRAEKALAALRSLSAPHASVLRDGREEVVPARDLVRGDIVFLRAGDRVPADMRLIEAVNLRADEAPLTGESVAVEKQADLVVTADAAVGDRRNMAFAGTAIAHGRGRAMVTGTAYDTEFGKIAHMLQTVEEVRTPLQENLDHIGRMLARAALVVVVLIVIAGLLRGQPWAEVLLFGIALAVAVVPEALPAVVTISLAIGVQRMARRNALVRKLPAVETLGCASVICSDKTGTMTRDEMTARKVITLEDSLDITGAGYEPKGAFQRESADTVASQNVIHLLQGGELASDAHVVFDEDEKSWIVQGDPTEGALVVAAMKAGIDIGALEKEFPRIGEVPFTSESKRMTTLHTGPDGMRAYVKGAAEMVLQNCTLVAGNDGDTPLDDSIRQRFAQASADMAGIGLRVLAIAWKRCDCLSEAENGLTLLGLVGLMDPPRAEVKSAIAECRSAGIDVIMITGDHPVTAQAIARELGLNDDKRLATGPEVEAMSDEELRNQAAGINIFARVSPAHKLRIVQALQKNGHVVVMTGDGVNDAPALKQADMGVAMGISGTDVSREAAAMTLTDDNFTSIVAAVEEGRGIYDNIRKYLNYLLSSNIGEILLLGGAAFAGLPLPLTTVQILYVNLATDGLPALALALDPPADDLMKRQPRSPRTTPFDRDSITLMLCGGVWSAVVNLTLFLWALHAGFGLEKAQTMAFVSLVLIQFLKGYNFRTGLLSMFHRPFANRWLNMAVAWELVLLIIILYWPVMQAPFGTLGLSWKEWLIVLPVTLSICPVLELVKAWLRRSRK